MWLSNETSRFEIGQNLWAQNPLYGFFLLTRYFDFNDLKYISFSRFSFLSIRDNLRDPIIKSYVSGWTTYASGMTTYLEMLSLGEVVVAGTS